MRRNHEEKVNRRNQFIVFFIAAIMILSVFGVIFYGTDSGEVRKYNHYKFVAVNNGYFTYIDGQRVFFNSFPGDLLEINIDNNAVSALRDKVEIDVTYDINDPLNQSILHSQYEFKSVVEQFSSSYVRGGITNLNEDNIPVITCDDAASAVPVVLFKQGPANSISFENSCITLEASDSQSMLMLKDRFLMGLMGIIE